MSTTDKPYKRIPLHEADVLSVVENISNLGYFSENDYILGFGVVQGRTGESLIMDVSLVVYNKKMLQDARVKELLLEYLV